MPGLGRRIPKDFQHVEKYPLRALIPTPIFQVNKVLPLPFWHWDHDQGEEGACVGFGGSMMMAILNRLQNIEYNARVKTVRYDPWWLWDRSKERDEWDDTNPGDDNGTSVRASCEVMRDLGHVRVKPVDRLPHYPGTLGKPGIDNGIVAYRWATNVDGIRTAIAAGRPVSLGINWYNNFDYPNDHWIGKGNLGGIRGGHCVCVYGASDDRQAFKIKNSWGRGYPLVWMPYETMERLIDEDGEACIITDR